MTIIHYLILIECDNWILVEVVDDAFLMSAVVFVILQILRSVY